MAHTLGLIGGGNMGRALIAALLSAGKFKPSEVVASDADGEKRAALIADFGIEATADNAAVLAKAQTVVLAVKPQIISAVLQAVGSRLKADQLLISVAAGVTCSSVEQQLPAGARVVRVMPNLPAVAQAGAAALCAGTHASAADLQHAKELFDAVGRTVVVAETQMDAVTGLSGSGPAYVMLVIEGLADGGVQMGLPRDVALLLAAQTVYGAARLLLESGEHPGALKDKVASPGGTTIAGIDALEQSGVRYAMMNAVKAATARARELGKPISPARS
ncbi:MAG TPA: pyrroline-5-carboxylate reductase [Polyangiaceae bacterium]|nr:pyrroline-5-carboxylate reductase [Polyangiaceae bacterium]